MNIELKLTVDEIKHIQQIIVIMRNFVIVATSNKDQLFKFSIILDVGSKIDKKVICLDEIYGSITRKKYKIKLKYHEAVILEKFLVDILNNESDPYNANLGRTIASQINQKLA